MLYTSWHTVSYICAIPSRRTYRHANACTNPVYTSPLPIFLLLFSYLRAWTDTCAHDSSTICKFHRVPARDAPWNIVFHGCVKNCQGIGAIVRPRETVTSVFHEFSCLFRLFSFQTEGARTRVHSTIINCALRGNRVYEPFRLKKIHY